MFENVGGKIKKISKAIFGIGTVITIVIALVEVFLGQEMLEKTNNDDAAVELMISFLVTTAVGILVSWLLSVFICGFGQLVENSDKIVFILSGSSAFDADYLDKKIAEYEDSKNDDIADESQQVAESKKEENTELTS